MEIKITCSGADLLPIDTLLEFQGSLKSISKPNLKKLKNSILKQGFTAPIFVWPHRGTHYILDGHQRLQALKSFKAEGYDIPDLPVAYIYADDEQQAKEKLLQITSQYGDFTLEGVQEFIAGMDIDFDSIRLTAGDFDIFESIDSLDENNNLKEQSISNSFDVVCEFDSENECELFYEEMQSRSIKCRLSIL